MRRRGFTLLEMVTVLGVVAICAAIAIFGLNRNREAISVERATALLRARIERAQSLASVAGSRLGTARVVFQAPCVPGPAQYLWVQFNAGGTAIIPSAVNYDEGTDLLTVRCEVWDVAVETKNLGGVELPAAALLFGFTADGRVLVPGQPAASVFISLRQNNGGRHFGLRVLPSGVVCAASDSVREQCDEEIT